MSREIVLDQVNKVYQKNEPVTVLNNVSFKIKASDIATLYGPSGSGKSTILNLASGLDLPTEGSIFLGSDRISAFDAHKLTIFRRQNIGFIFQGYNLFGGLSALENVEIISLLNGVDPAEARRAAAEALEKVGLKERQNHFPAELSGGQQQRVAVARAIASKPSVLFADEPTANLDSHTAQSIIELLFELNRSIGTTILFSTHDPNIIEKVHTIIKIKDGEIIHA
jgi:putative ABC transport system ATP-binding protein